MEEVPDKKMISEVPEGLLNLFLAGNQGAYGCMCHWCRFHQCPKISSVKTWVKRKMTESGERHPLQHCWQMSKPFRGQFVNIYQNLKHAYSRPSNIISKNLSCRYSYMYRKIYMCENIYCSKGCNEKKKKWKQPKYPPVVECLNTSGISLYYSMKLMWPLQTMMWISGFECVAENLELWLSIFHVDQNHLGRSWRTQRPRLIEGEEDLGLCVSIRFSS